jgi:hypothetical protein
MYRHVMPIRTVLGALVLLVSMACAVTSASAQGEFPTGAYAAGNLTLTFSGDGKYTVSEKGEVVVEGTYTVTQDQIVVTDKQGRYACTEPGASIGKYQWKYDGQALTFSKLEDACQGRIGGLTGQPLMKQKE